MSCNNVIVNQPTETVLVDSPEVTVVQSVTEVTDVIESTDNNVIVTTEEVNTVISEGLQGPPGQDGAAVSLYKELIFDYSQISTSLVIGATVANQKISQTVLQVTDDFDGELGITVGTSVSNALLMTIAENSPDNEGTYSKLNNLLPKTTDVFSAFFTYDDAPTTGSATITIYF